MGRLFGTDGTRGFFTDINNTALAEKIASAAAAFIPKKKISCPVVLIGHDGSKAAEDIAEYVYRGAVSAGADIKIFCGVPTAAAAYLVKNHEADAGIFISDSGHNGCYMRMYETNGRKLSDEQLEEIEQIVFGDINELESIFRKREASKECIENVREEYFNHIKEAVDVELSGIKAALHCRDNIISSVAERLFTEMGAEVCFMPEDFHLDEHQTRTEQLMEFVVRNNCCCGLEYGRSGERVLAVDESGGLFDCNKLAAVFSKDMKERGLLKNNTLVASAAANLGLINFAKTNDINIVTAGNDERSIALKMSDCDYSIGIDKSGRIIFKDSMPSGDGLMAGAELLGIIKRSGRKMSEFSEIMQQFPQVMVNVRIHQKYREIWKNDIAITDLIEHFENMLGSSGRITVRESPAEPMISVVVEGEDFSAVNRIAVETANRIKFRCPLD